MPNAPKCKLANNVGSVTALLLGVIRLSCPKFRVVVFNDREEAAYFYNDMLAVSEDKRIAFFPSSYRRMIKEGEKDYDSVLVRTEVLNNINNGLVDTLITFPEALVEKVVNRRVLADLSMVVHQQDKLSISFVENLLVEYGFERTDFVYEPGQVSIRGSIIDVYSFAEERPARIDFFGDEVDSIRFFDLETQLSDTRIESFSIVPDLSHSEQNDSEQRTDLFSYFPIQSEWWIKNGMFVYDKIKALHADLGDAMLSSEREWMNYVEHSPVVEWGPDLYFR